MDINDWIHFEKKKNKDFSIKKFAEDLGSSVTRIYQLKMGYRPSFKLAMKVEQLTRGEVLAWEMIKNGISRKKGAKNEVKLNKD